LQGDDAQDISVSANVQADDRWTGTLVGGRCSALESGTDQPPRPRAAARLHRSARRQM